MKKDKAGKEYWNNVWDDRMSIEEINIDYYTNRLLLDLYKKYFVIPESFFWSRITFEAKPYSYFINKRLGIVYRNEGGNISANIRMKYPEGFLFESLFFINNYKFIIYKSPTTYMKHLVKYTIFSYEKNETVFATIKKLDGVCLKLCYLLLLFPSLLYKKQYLKGKQ